MRATKRYTAATIDWLAVDDVTTDRCYYVPASQLGACGRAELRLRVEPARNGQRAGIRLAADYLSF
ncbi:MAG TPA: group I intron-associated PD-(D/E)XK endonuclease [Capillimicrobium sp.]|nr:group I intron-associated PD-(D/E)XK endonuclease [Capillimicrobium sp.]